MRREHIFLVVFALSLLTHGVYWKHLDDSVDQQNWIREIRAFHDTTLVSQRSSLYYGYPATTFLSAGSFFMTLGVSADRAFAGVMTITISILIAFCALLCRLLRPYTLWWVAVVGVMVPSQLYYAATPPSAIVTACSTLVLLYALYIYENRKNDTYTTMLLGALVGISLATRIDISLIILLFICIFLFPVMKKQLNLVLVSAVAVFVLCDPYIWTFPFVHLADIFLKITTHASRGDASAFPVRQLFLTVPLSGLGLMGSALLLLFPRALFYSVPRAFLIVVLSMCLSVSVGLILLSGYHPTWYFYPLLQIFELLFVLYLVDAIMFIRRRFVLVPALGILLVGNTVIFFRKLFL